MVTIQINDLYYSCQGSEEMIWQYGAYIHSRYAKDDTRKCQGTDLSYMANSH